MPRFPFPVPHSSYLYLMKVDYLIVGQGIAGSVMALTLKQRGKPVAIINDSSLSSSSRIAAGVYNPFNFRRTKPVWKAREAALAAYNFYNAFEQESGIAFHHPRRIKRLFASEAERKEWDEYRNSTREFIMPEVLKPISAAHLIEPFGSGFIERGGLIDTRKFIEATKNQFSNCGYYLDEQFDHAKLFVGENTASYDNRVEATHVIFCEGHLARTNPYFDSRTVAPTKGELLHVSIPGFNMPGVVHGQVYVAMLGDDCNDQYACGATFNPGKDDEEITASGKEELITKLKSITELPFEVIGHFAGVRPAGRDRKPVLGRSKNHRNLSIFNGFGSKAVLMSPLLAQVLADHLENGVELPPEVNVARFKVY
jgi:glycine oxidase